MVCCRDGLALLVNVHPGQVLVWDPVTGDRRSLLLPLVFRNCDKIYHGMVLRSAAAAAVGDGDCFRFQVVLVRCIKGRHARAVACVYSSDTGAWGDLIQISTPRLRSLSMASLGALVGRSLYWLLDGNSPATLEFDLDRQTLAMISPSSFSGWIMSGESGLASVSFSGHRVQLWKKETDSYGVAKRLLTKTIDLDKLLALSPGDRFAAHFSEEGNMLILGSVGSIRKDIFTVQVESMQVKKLPGNFKESPYVFRPFASVYTAGTGMPLHCWYYLLIGISLIV
jgi:hypothetical protein